MRNSPGELLQTLDPTCASNCWLWRETAKLFVYLQAHGFSEEASFTAAPEVGPHTHVKFLAIADMGQAEVDGSNEQSEMLPALNTTRLMIAEADDKQLFIHNGDISYARYASVLHC